MAALMCNLCKSRCTSQAALAEHERISTGHHLQLQLFGSSGSPSAIPLHLDALFIQYFRWNERRISMLDELRKIIADGLFELGRARYHHGTKAISALSFDMKMRALSIVERQSDGSLVLRSAPGDQYESDEEEDFLRTEPKEGLRNRNAEEKASRSAPVKENRDPLRWFGVLVPQSLRSSQTHFRKALHTCIAVASIVSQIQALQTEYLRLLEVKQTGV